jgi:hypothetical protein
VSVTGRDRSNTPLQPLITLHGPMFVEATQAFAERVQQDVTSGLAEQIAYAFRLAVARAPSAEELSELQQLYNDSKVTFQASPASATSVVGDYQPAGVDAPSAAAWVSTARVILNLDELITRE